MTSGNEENSVSSAHEEMDPAATEAKWDEPVLPPDDFADEDDDSKDDDDLSEDDQPKKSKSGLMIFGLLAVVALGGAGFAYTQFGSTPVIADISATAPVLASNKPTVLVQDTAQIKNEPPVDPVVVAAASPELPNSKTVPEVPSPAMDGAPVQPAFPSLPKIDTPAIAPVEPSSAKVDVINENKPAENAKTQNMIVAQMAETKPETSSSPLEVKPAVVDMTEKNKNTAAPVVAQGLAQMLTVKTDNPVNAVAAASNQAVAEESHNAKENIAPKPTAHEAVVSSRIGQQEKIDELVKPIVSPVRAIKPESKADKNVQAHGGANKKTPAVVKIADRVVKKIIAADSSGHGNKKVVGKVVANKAVPSVSSHYTIQSAMAGEAWIAKSSDVEMIQHVSVGDVLPEVGKIKSIVENDGKWAVIGSLKTVY